MSNNFVVVKTHPSLISFVDYLQRKNAESLSFYPKCVFEREMEKGRIFLGLLNGQPCGYIYVGSLLKQDVKCHQVCIEYDIRRQFYGTALVEAMENYAISGNAFSVTLRCGFDLDANKFWQSLGYKCIAIVDGGVRRMRKINIWRKQFLPELFTRDELEAVKGKTDASLWRKYKQTGLISGFARGKTLEIYRKRLLSKENK